MTALINSNNAETQTTIFGIDKETIAMNLFKGKVGLHIPAIEVNTFKPNNKIINGQNLKTDRVDLQ